MLDHSELWSAIASLSQGGAPPTIYQVHKLRLFHFHAINKHHPSERIEMASSQTLLADAKSHLRTVIDVPETPLEASLLDRVRTEAVPSIAPEDRKSLISLVVEFLHEVKQDPSSVTKLAEDLFQPLTYSEIINYEAPDQLVAGLNSQSPPIQLLSIGILGLAAKHTGDVGIVAGHTVLAAALTDAWLTTPDISVAERARQVLSSLLLAEGNVDQQGDGVPATATLSESIHQGLMQRRFFKDKSVYSRIFAHTNISKAGDGESPLGKREKTVAQGRLLDLLRDIWVIPDVWQSQIQPIEQHYGSKPGEGLMHYATLHMIDKADVLLRVTQIDFITDLVNSVHTKTSSQVTRGQLLEFLTTTGLHDDIMSIYTSPERQDALDVSFYYAPAAKYVAAFSQNYYEHLLSDTSMRTRIFKRLHEVLDAVPSSQWARNDGPAHDLHVLVSIPRLILVPDPILVMRLPTRPASADAFRTLAYLFSGQISPQAEPEIFTFPPPKEGASHNPSATTGRVWQHAEQWASRHLFLKYIDQHPAFWTNVIEASSVTAFKDTAIAAIDLVNAMVKAQWQTEPGETNFGVDLSGTAAADPADHGWYGNEPPANGVAAIIHPQVLDVLLPLIEKRPEGRGVGLLGSDTESAAYHIQQAKLRLLAALETGIRDVVTRIPDGSEEKAMLSELAAGFSRLRRQGHARRNDAGMEVGTMEL